MKRLTAVAYVVNGSGLGHLTRTLAIARWLRRLSRLAGLPCDLYLLTSSEGSALAFEEGFPAFKIPSKTVIRDAGMPKEDYLRLARQWVWHSLGLLRPDLLLVDTFPGGSFGELFHALDGPSHRVFIHRAMKESFAQQEAIQALLPLYDQILIPEEPGSPRRELAPKLRSKARYLGPILLREREELRPRQDARRRLGVPNGKLAVWLSAGGGGGDPTAVDALRSMIDALRHDETLHLVVGAGPLYRGEPVRGPGITWLTSFYAAEDFSGLDLAISAAGYNSFHELLHSGVPTAFFAQEKVADEQDRRANAAAAAGCALALPSQGGAPEREALLSAIALFKDPARRASLSEAAQAFVPKNFAKDAAAEILSPFVPAQALEEAVAMASPSLFLALEGRSLALDAVEPFFRSLGRASDIEPEDRRELLLSLLSSSPLPGELSLRLFGALSKRLPPPGSLEEAEALVEASSQILQKLAPFDERGSLALLRLLPEGRELRPEILAQDLCPFLGCLAEKNESLWSGLALLGRHQSEARPFLQALSLAAKELSHGQEGP